jgi:GT2 family glycosyltransferase
VWPRTDARGNRGDFYIPDAEVTTLSSSTITSARASSKPSNEAGRPLAVVLPHGDDVEADHVSTGDPRVGVVVLTHDRPQELERTLGRMRALPEQPRLIVVDNAGSVSTALIRRFPGVELLRLPRNLGAAGRNAGVALLRTPYVAFCDDDTWWAPGALRRAADLLDEHPPLAVVTGKVLVGLGARLDPTCALMAQSPLRGAPGLPGRSVLGFRCAATMVRRRAFQRVGGFEPRFFLGGEEQLLAIDLAAAGFALAYVDDVVVHHHPSPRRERARRRRLLRNALWCAWLRRPATTALRTTWAIARAHLGDPALAPALASALAGTPWIVRRRRVVPLEVEERLCVLERPARHGTCLP